MYDAEKWAEAIDGLLEEKARVLADPPVASEPVWWTTLAYPYGEMEEVLKKNSCKCQNWITARAKLGGDPKRIDLMLTRNQFIVLQLALEEEE